MASHAESVEKVSRNGRPLAKPSGKISRTRRSPYTVSECRQFVMTPSQPAYFARLIEYAAFESRAQRFLGRGALTVIHLQETSCFRHPPPKSRACAKVERLWYSECLHDPGTRPDRGNLYSGDAQT